MSLKLSEIQKRCSELMDKPQGLQLRLEESEARTAGTDPYNRTRHD
ncbi:MAG: hypothetical protein ACE5FV_10165 [Woeseia sp.]